MITRGYYIGQIIDEFTSISHQVKSRAGLKLYDLNIHLENFFRDVLNITHNLQLINLNEERSNNPGLDLGDESKKIAFQITSTKTSFKVEETLKKSLPQKDKFSEIYILILGEKQTSYTLEAELTSSFNFTKENNILDIEDILKKVMLLPIEPLQTLYDFVSKEVARVKIELEIPDKNGKYQTNIDSFIEQIPKEQFLGISSYYNYWKEKDEKYEEIEIKNILKDFQVFIKSLKNLPRITRQFYAFLLQRGKWDDCRRYITIDYLNRICNFPDMQGEIRLLSEHNLCWYEDPTEPTLSATIQISTVNRANSYEFTWEFLEFIEQKNIPLEKVIVSLDFSDFN
ncbi:MAG: SMEK domain-containing protein [Bacilli bacterium]